MYSATALRGHKIEKNYKILQNAIKKSIKPPRKQ